MNIVDYVIIGLLGVSVLFGLYRGFIASVLNTGGCLVSFFAAFKFGPQLAALVQGNATLQDTLGHYTDISSRLGDLDLALTNVQDLVRKGGQAIHDVVAKVGLPKPLAALLESNLVNQAYSGSVNVNTVQDYISQTILTACINILCFLICFGVVYLVISIVVAMLKAIFKFPVLKQLDSLAGGAFGLLRGLLICYILMAVIPLVQTMLPINMVNELIDESQLAHWFTGGDLIVAITNGGLWTK